MDFPWTLFTLAVRAPLTSRDQNFTMPLDDSEIAAGAFCDFVAVWWCRLALTNPGGFFLMARRPRRPAESTSYRGEKGEFPKGCHKRPYTLHRNALLWSNRNGGWGQNVVYLA